MLKLDEAGRFISQLAETTFFEEGLHERILQNLINQNRQVTLDELGEAELLLLRPETLASDSLRDRIDLLGVDTDGTVVIIELKRGRHKLHLLQAVSYAAMIAGRTADWFKNQAIEQNVDYFFENIEEVALNHRQRIILIAESFEPQVIVAAKWLKQFGISVRCIEASLCADRTANRQFYIHFRQVFPTEYLDQILPSEADKMPEAFEKLLSDLQSLPPPRKPKTSSSKQHADKSRDTASFAAHSGWPSAIDSFNNKCLVDFIRMWNEQGEKILPDSGYRLVFPRKGERWRIQPRADYAWVMQSGRFHLGTESDEDFWRSRLEDTASVRPLRNGTRLHFYLRTKNDFEVFWTSITDTLREIEFEKR